MPLGPSTMAGPVFSQVAVAPKVSDAVFSTGLHWARSAFDVIDDPFDGHHVTQFVHRKRLSGPLVHCFCPFWFVRFPDQRKPHACQAMLGGINDQARKMSAGLDFCFFQWTIALFSLVIGRVRLTCRGCVRQCMVACLRICRALQRESLPKRAALDGWFHSANNGAHAACCKL